MLKLTGLKVIKLTAVCFGIAASSSQWMELPSELDTVEGASTTQLVPTTTRKKYLYFTFSANSLTTFK